MKRLLAVSSILAVLASPALAQPGPNDSAQGPAQGAMWGPGMMGQGWMWHRGMWGGGMAGCPMAGMMGYGDPHTEGRLAFLKTELKITGAQEKAWEAYANTLRAADKRNASAAGSWGWGGMGAGRRGWGTMGPGMMGQGVSQQGPALSAPEALENRIEFAEAHLKSLKELQAATKALYGVLDTAQKKTADELLGPSCGMGW